jgi:hypothetical protein
MNEPSALLPELPNGAYGVYTDYYDGTTVSEPFDRWQDIELFSREQIAEHGLECYRVGLDDAAYLIAQGVDLLKGSGEREGDELVEFVREKLHAAVTRQIAPDVTAE